MNVSIVDHCIEEHTFFTKKLLLGRNEWRKYEIRNIENNKILTPLKLMGNKSLLSSSYL